MVKCLICEHTSPNYRGLGCHIALAHGMTTQNYYNLYLKKDNEDICQVCGNHTNFINLALGYRKVCSISCGQKHPNTRNKIEATNIARYGKTTPLLTEESLQKSHNKQAMTKKRATMIERYGYPNSFCTMETQHKVQQTLLNRYGNNNPMCGNLLKKHNGTRSSWENILKTALLEHNIPFEYEYNKDLRYPYPCDFYLPNTDTFVEINGYFTHNNHWFDETSQADVSILNEWKEKAKTSDRMQMAIDIWTRKDVEKRKCAKQNKLNYVVLWTLEDIHNWIASNFEIRHDY